MQKKKIIIFPGKFFFMMIPFIFLLFAFMPFEKNPFIKKPFVKNMEKVDTGLRSLYPSVFTLTDDDILWIEETIEKMTVKEKVAHLIMPWVQGRYYNESSANYQRLVTLVRDHKVGGLIFFQGDVTNQATLINRMQEFADVPLLISADFERGLAMRIEDATSFPYNMALGATQDEELVKEMAKIVAKETRALGVHQNYAPVADINNNADNPIINIRSYAEDVDLVSKLCVAFIKGSHEGNVVTTVKHFPGHGDTNIDSHKDLPRLSFTENRILNFELKPFIASIKAGVKSVMIGHLEVPSIEPEKGLPATLSYQIITRLLKERLGFEGLVVTDAMNMNAVTNYFSAAEAAVLAIKAGNDLLLMPPDEEIAIDAIYTAVLSGEIPFTQIETSLRKVLAAKRWLGLHKNRFVDVDNLLKVIGNKEHWDLARDIARRSITLVKNDDKVIPVDPDFIQRTAVITLADAVDSKRYHHFNKIVENNFNVVESIVLNRSSRNRDYDAALALAKQSDFVLLPAYVRFRAYRGTIQLPAQHENFVKDLLKLKKQVVLISFGNPYILTLFPNVSTYLAAYSDVVVSQDAMLEAILGQITIEGKLPVSIPKTPFKFGDGIFLQSDSLYIDEETTEGEYDFSGINDLMQQAISEKVFPGGVVAVGYKGKLIHHHGYGKQTYEENSPTITTETIFDLASVTKVVATTTAAMILYDEGKLDLDQKVSFYLPEFGNNGKENVTVRNLLLHNAGLRAWRPYYNNHSSEDEVINTIMNEELDYPIGSKMVYSDPGIITLQKIIEKISGLSLDEYVRKNIFVPLNMNRTLFNPPQELWYNIPPTQPNYKGKVHDGNAAILGGVAGHAGLFAPASDLAIFCKLMLQKGKYGKKQYIKPETIEEWTSKQSEQSSRGLGWDTKSSTGSSAGSLFSEKAFGHTGFTGTSIWLDKEKDLFVILLTNRVYPDSENRKISEFRPKLHDAVVKSIR